MAEYEERTEQATPRKRQKAREEGRIARSRDLATIASVGGILLFLYLGGNYFIKGIKNVTWKYLSLQYGNEPVTILRAASIDTMIIMAPFLGMAFLFAVSANIAQGGVVFKPAELKLDMVNPLSGLKKIFSFSGLTEFFKSLIKFSVGAYLFYYVIKKYLPELSTLTAMDMANMLRTSSNLLIKTIAYGFFWFFIVGMIDYFLQKWQFERSLRMSREEIKEEFKESEGDPMVKSRIKSIQREMARRRMMQEVPKATVVITNPTHIAVALKYEDGKMSAPKVVAKGANRLAEKIREIAREHNVPVVEDRPLARALFKLELDTYIPQELYKAVAKILAYIYRLRRVA